MLVVFDVFTTFFDPILIYAQIYPNLDFTQAGEPATHGQYLPVHCSGPRQLDGVR